jgi:hypothetical protein
MAIGNSADGRFALCRESIPQNPSANGFAIF